LDMLCQVGGAIPQITHGESGAPREILRIFLDAIKDYSGRIKVLGYDDFLTYIRSKGTVAADGRTFVCTNLGHAANYRLRGDSPCIRNGDMGALVGVPNLHDLDGTAVTDAKGTFLLTRTPIDIGSYVYLTPGRPQVSISKGSSSSAAEVTVLGDEGGYYQLQQTKDFADWFPVTNFVGTTTSVVSNPEASPMFYRGMVLEN
jgi:hypothetical protein